MKGLFSFLGGAVMGALVGATLVLLLTPSSGENLRQQMRQRVQAVQSEVKQAASERRSELKQQLNELRAPKSS